MREEQANNIRYLSALIASALMEGLNLEEIKNLYAIIHLISCNIQSEIVLRGHIAARLDKLNIIPALSTYPNSQSKDNKDKK